MKVLLGFLVVGILIGFGTTTNVQRVVAAPIDVCGQAAAESHNHHYVLATVGCEEDGTRAGNACNRLAYRLAKAALRSGTTVLNILSYVKYRVEEYSSNGHPCRQFEDGSYGFPSKKIDCLVDPRC